MLKIVKSLRETASAPRPGGEREKNAAQMGGVLNALPDGSALGELQGLGADPAKHPVISSLSTGFLA